MHTHGGIMLKPIQPLFPRHESRLAAATVPLLLAPVWVAFGRDTPGMFGTIAGMVILLLVLTCAMTDLAERKIFNWATYTAIFWAMGINLTGELVGNRPGLGAVGMTDSLAGAGICLVLMLVAYNLAQGGAGDVKLAVAIGALLGSEVGVLAVAYSYVVAAVCILGWVSWHRGPMELIQALMRKIGDFLFPGFVISVDGEQQALLEKPVPLAGFFAIGTILAMLEPVLQ
jgi:Flp pilus assembly protein protease CpaA